MTNKDIKSVQIIAELNNGTHIIALSDNRMLINVIVSLCQFQRIDETQVCKVPLEEILAEINMKGGEE
jgi:hypothetical protein